MRTFNITPKPRMLIGVQNQKWTVSGAVAELIDNAFGPGRGNASIVRIVYDAAERKLTVADNGQGMEYIGRLFQLGNTIGRTAGDIGNFGSGGTQAIIWLPEWVHVATQRDGMIMHDRIRWADVFAMEDFRDVAVSNEWKKGRLTQFSEWDRGTAIQMHVLRERRINVSNIIRDLSRLFAPGLRSGKQIIFRQTRSGELVDEQFLTDPFEVAAEPLNEVRFNAMVSIDSDLLPVHGRVCFDDKTSHADSWVRIGFSYREIMRTRDCFKCHDEAYAGVGVSGWLDLGDGWQPYLTTTKDAMNHQPLYDSLMEHVFREIRQLLILAEQRTVDFELDNLAIGLEIALERTMKIKVKVERDCGNSGNGSGSSGSGENRTRPETETRGIARIRLIKQDDKDMMGALARSGDDPKGLYVDINKDHAFVREAMRQKPINSAALNLMIVTEIAALLAEKSDLAKQAFRPTVVDRLGDLDGPERVRTLVRYMIDNIPSKHANAAAA